LVSARWNAKAQAIQLSRRLLEVFEEQEHEFEEQPQLRRFYDEYEMPLARAFQSIDKHGVLTDAQALAKLRAEVLEELDKKCVEVSRNLNNRPVVYSNDMGIALAKQLNISPEAVFNIASVPQLKKVLVNELKIKLAVDRQTKKESTGEESLNEAFAATGNPVLKNVLRIRELNKVLGTYIDARLGDGVLYSCYSVTGTVTGRRASRKNFLGLGTNGQNQPKHESSLLDLVIYTLIAIKLQQKNGSSRELLQMSAETIAVFGNLMRALELVSRDTLY